MAEGAEFGAELGGLVSASLHLCIFPHVVGLDLTIMLFQIMVSVFLCLVLCDSYCLLVIFHSTSRVVNLHLLKISHLLVLLPRSDGSISRSSS